MSSVCVITMEFPEDYGDLMEDREFLETMVRWHVQCGFWGVKFRVTVNGEGLVIQQTPDIGNA